MNGSVAEKNQKISEKLHKREKILLCFACQTCEYTVYTYIHLIYSIDLYIPIKDLFLHNMKDAKMKYMRIVAIVESDDCGPAAILDSDCVSVTKIDNMYFAAARCVFTQMPITCEISEQDANALIENGVNCITVSSLGFTSEDKKGIERID